MKEDILFSVPFSFKRFAVVALVEVYDKNNNGYKTTSVSYETLTEPTLPELYEEMAKFKIRREHGDDIEAEQHEGAARVGFDTIVEICQTFPPSSLVLNDTKAWRQHTEDLAEKERLREVRRREVEQVMAANKEKKAAKEKEKERQEYLRLKALFEPSE